ncbi:MAG: PAS domain S-box protein [Methylococcus sp.]
MSAFLDKLFAFLKPASIAAEGNGTSAPASADAERLAEELRVYQTELEVQNDELRSAQSKLSSSLEKYRKLFGSLPLPCLVVDGKGVVQELNQQALIYFDFKLNPVFEGFSLYRLFDADGQARLHPLLKPRLEDETTVLREVWLGLGERKTHFCDLHLIHFFDPVTEQNQILLVLLDLSVQIGLRQSEAGLRRILDYAPVPMGWMTNDPGHKVIDVNRRFSEVLGYTLEDIPTLEDWARQAYPDEAYRRQLSMRWETEMNKATLHTGHVPEHELRIVCKDGTIRNMLSSSTQLDDMTFFTLMDITEARALQQRLAASARRYEHMLSASNDAFWLADTAGRLLDVNDAAVTLSGYSREELIGMHILDLDVEDHADAFAARMQAILAEGWGLFETRHRTRDGRILDVEVSTLPDQESGTLVVFVRDITQRRATENQLRQLSLALEQSVESIVITDLDARIEYVNEAFLRETGYTREEVMGQNPRVLQSGKTPQATFAAMRAALAAGESWQGEFNNRRKDGSEYIEWASISPVRQPDGRITHYVAVKLNITDRKYYETELIEARLAAESASRAKSRFLAHMSHELRTPLNAILGFTQILEQETLNPEQHEMIGMINEAGGNLLRIISDILDLSQLDSGRLTLEFQSFSLPALLDRVDRVLRRGAQEKGLGWLLEQAPADLESLAGDAQRLEQILINLLGNAIKFTHQGEVRLRIILSDPAADPVRLRFEVSDTGIGIPREMLDHLFQPFNQGDSSLSRRYGGTGLGLVISKRFTELMGGAIGATSQPGQGSTFWFEIPFPRPVTMANRDTGTVAAATPTHQDLALAGLRVLAVDDNRINQRMVEQALVRQGAQVKLAAEGEAALRMLRADPGAFDLVLMDIQMPVMDGLTATREIRQEPGLAGLPVIALTAGALPEEREAALAAGVDDFLTKPMQVIQLLNVIRRHCTLPSRSA